MYLLEGLRFLRTKLNLIKDMSEDRKSLGAFELKPQ